MGLFLSAPVHAMQTFGLPCLSFGSVKATILPNNLPLCSYISTWDVTLPFFSSTVFHLPTGDSAATTEPAPSRTIKDMKKLNCFILSPLRLTFFFESENPTAISLGFWFSVLPWTSPRDFLNLPVCPSPRFVNAVGKQSNPFFLSFCFAR